MQLSPEPNSPERQRVLIVAHCFDADYSMESRLSWLRAKNAARQYDTTVICVEPYADVQCDVNPQVSNLQVITVAHTAMEKRLIDTPFGFYLAYRLWHRRVLRTARELHKQKPFSLVHQVSYCGYREPGYCWKLGVPFVWGPIGGTQDVPWRFLRTFDAMGAAKEAWRSLVNQVQLRFGLRVGRALTTADAVYAANRQARRSFRRARGMEIPCQLETGLERAETKLRELRDMKRPLRVLWAGRLECWKALPLLLRAIARTPDEADIKLRVLGSGTRETRYRQMAEALGIADRVEWVPLPDYNLRDEHYQWADVFAFTSLRDTSGTGLLESLAAGVAIVGVDHQGARDIMTPACAIPIPVRDPEQVIDAFREGLVRVASDPHFLQRLSNGALKRARRFHWDALNSEMMACYGKILGGTSQVTLEEPTDSAVDIPTASGVSV
ncbi:MAG: glycosyltransferase [Planctomycetota bacterium]